MNPTVLQVALAAAALVVFGSVVALIVGALCAAGRADDRLARYAVDYYIARDDLGNEYVVPVLPEADGDQ